jgi:hypothetical protein
MAVMTLSIWGCCGCWYRCQRTALHIGAASSAVVVDVRVELQQCPVVASGGVERLGLLRCWMACVPRKAALV